MLLFDFYEYVNIIVSTSDLICVQWHVKCNSLWFVQFSHYLLNVKVQHVSVCQSQAVIVVRFVLCTRHSVDCGPVSLS